MRNTVLHEPTSDEMATVGSIENKPPELAAAHRAIVMRNSWQRADTSWRQWQEQLSQAMKDRIWEVYPNGAPAGSLPALLEYLEIDSSCALSRDKFEERPILPHGGDRRSPEFQDSDTTLVSPDRGAEYLTRRIARDRPDILESMKAGEYDSVRQAAIDAGIVKPRISMPSDPQAAGRYLAERVDREWFEAMMDAYYKGIEE